jgi:hypothetical protein
MIRIIRGTISLAVLALAISFLVRAADDLSGKWTAAFDTQIGEQHYTYDFKVAGGTVTGSAKSDNGDVQITEGKLSGDTLTFVENLKIQGMDIRIEYTGKISGDEIKFTRKVADFATETLLAKRAK